jgi:hypothetical protein
MSASPKNNVPKNPPPLPAGMDNPWYDFVPFPKRPRLNWPGNARVASSGISSQYSRCSSTNEATRAFLGQLSRGRLGNGT